MTGSTLPARSLGRLLAQYRQRAGLSRSAAAQIVETSIQTMGRLEDGLKSKVPQLWINALADAYRVSDSERRVLIGLTRELASAQQNWWRPYADEMNPRFDHYLGLEEAARRLAVWRLSLLPGLLQTPEYRRAIAWTEWPDLATEQVNKRVEMAVRRQVRLNDRAFTVDAILSETVLREQIGGPAVMAEQMARLVELSELPNVSIRVVPFNAPRHLGSRVGSFAMLEFPKLPATGMIEPPVIYIEDYAGDGYLEREVEVRRYRDAFTEIARVSLDPDATRHLLVSAGKEYRA
ncbi:helix-turn-helix transcriptional regulator [Nocardia sp. CDC153]|uniref:helix-turn-helix domain-containing protein n=1 Tax=Nocardia sp. CDC153 TaxID=3112167 RepID=UPI002DB7CEB2|nr:helix-turn-helix transcriptional regulator [Nocardia sp. CDC153]MEC3957707.1 helix-turn-helix transcriptional regulator [Nocardia sp. CDC153]